MAVFNVLVVAVSQSMIAGSQPAHNSIAMQILGPFSTSTFAENAAVAIMQAKPGFSADISAAVYQIE